MSTVVVQVNKRKKASTHDSFFILFGVFLLILYLVISCNKNYYYCRLIINPWLLTLDYLHIKSLINLFSKARDNRSNAVSSPSNKNYVE